jgi:hypothetical protein
MEEKKGVRATEEKREERGEGRGESSNTGKKVARRGSAGWESCRLVRTLVLHC